MESAVEYFSKPDPEVRVIAGRDWARIHPKTCPACGATFWTWKPLDAEWEPHRSDPMPTDRSQFQRRDVCGRAKCHEIEQDQQWERRKPKTITL